MAEKAEAGKEVKKTKSDSEVVLHVGADQLDNIEKASREKEEREEKERKENLEALEVHCKEEKLRDKEKDKFGWEDEGKKKEKEHEEVPAVVKGISFVFLLVATILGGIVSVGMILAEFYIVYHFDLCTACYVLIIIQAALIVIGTIARWLSWYIKIKTGNLGDD